MKRFLFLVAWLLSAIATCAQAGEATLSWTYPAPELAAGFKIYVGTTSRLYNPPIDVGYVLTYTVKDLAIGTTFFFTATAYDLAGNESDYSNEVFKTITSSDRCDLNGDSAVNAADLQALANFIVRGSPLIAGDINADGKTNVLDLQILANVILGRQLCPGQ